MAKMATESLNEEEGDIDEDENHVKYDTSKGNEIAQQVAAMSPLLAIESTDTISVLYSRKPAEELIKSEQEFQAVTVVVGDGSGAGGSISSDPGGSWLPSSSPRTTTLSPFAPKNIKENDVSASHLNVHSGVKRRRKERKKESRSLDSGGLAGSFSSHATLKSKTQRVDYTVAEVIAIYNGVEMFGADFRTIYYAYMDVFHPKRTPIKLYDKWRHDLSKWSKVEYMTCKFGIEIQNSDDDGDEETEKKIWKNIMRTEWTYATYATGCRDKNVKGDNNIKIQKGIVQIITNAVAIDNRFPVFPYSLSSTL